MEEISTSLLDFLCKLLSKNLIGMHQSKNKSPCDESHSIDSFLDENRYEARCGMHEWRFSYLLGVKSAFLRVTFVSQRKRRIWAKSPSCNREGGERKKSGRALERSQSINLLPRSQIASDWLHVWERLTLSLRPSRLWLHVISNVKHLVPAAGDINFVAKPLTHCKSLCSAPDTLWLIRRRANQTNVAERDVKKWGQKCPPTLEIRDEKLNSFVARDTFAAIYTQSEKGSFYLQRRSDKFNRERILALPLL